MKGYQYQPQSGSSLDREEEETAEVAKTAGKVFLGTAIAVVAEAAMAACTVLWVLAGGI